MDLAPNRVYRRRALSARPADARSRRDPSNHLLVQISEKPAETSQKSGYPEDRSRQRPRCGCQKLDCVTVWRHQEKTFPRGRDRQSKSSRDASSEGRSLDDAEPFKARCNPGGSQLDQNERTSLVVVWVNPLFFLTDFSWRRLQDGPRAFFVGATATRVCNRRRSCDLAGLPASDGRPTPDGNNP